MVNKLSHVFATSFWYQIHECLSPPLILINKYRWLTVEVNKKCSTFCDVAGRNCHGASTTLSASKAMDTSPTFQTLRHKHIVHVQSTDITIVTFTWPLLYLYSVYVAQNRRLFMMSRKTDFIRVFTISRFCNRSQNYRSSQVSPFPISTVVFLPTGVRLPTVCIVLVCQLHVVINMHCIFLYVNDLWGHCVALGPDVLNIPLIAVQFVTGIPISVP